MKYPFLFRLEDPYVEKALDRWVVKIATFDYSRYNSAWMNDDTLGETCLIPNVQEFAEEHRFTSEQEAMKFIKEWWSK